jgi:hypothetical protein
MKSAEGVPTLWVLEVVEPAIDEERERNSSAIFRWLEFTHRQLCRCHFLNAQIEDGRGKEKAA